MLDTRAWIDETLRSVGETRISVRELTELRRKAAAYDAGERGVGLTVDGQLEAYIDCGADAEQDTQVIANKYNAEDSEDEDEDAGDRWQIASVRLVKEVPQ